MIQGEGRGHLTQALTVSQLLSARGHEIVGVVVGQPGHRDVPTFVRNGFPVDIETLPSPGFVVSGHRSLNMGATLLQGLAKAGGTYRSTQRLRRIVTATRPDLILNFFEPLVGLAQLIHPLGAPVVSIAHQFMFGHPEYRWPARLGWQGRGLRAFVDLVGWRSWKLALSLEPAADLERQRVVVSPPLLRPALRALEPSAGDYYLVYLLNHGYAADVRAWHADHPHEVLHCFYDRPGAPDEERVAPNLTFHRLNGEKFLGLMAGCRAVVCTAGFESVGEAAWLGKSVFLVPVEGHIEQALNAAEAERLGLGLADPTFNLDRIRDLPRGVARSEYRAWVDQAEGRLIRVLELARAQVA